MSFLQISIGNITLWALFGLAIAWIAHHKDPIPTKGGLLATICFAVLGAISGGYFASLLLGVAMLDFRLEGLLFAVVGALCLAVFFRSSFHDSKYIRIFK
jgi:uncharacterized membrane protein YeaQ/YmgE (transglycosylase-associated protein family)